LRSSTGKIIAMALIAVFAFSLVLSGCAKPKEEVILGLIAPLTGSKADQGRQFKEGAEAAVKVINEEGGILGHPVRLEIIDDEGRPENAANAASRLAAMDGVIAVVGPSSTASVSAAAPILQDAGLILWSPAASTGSLVTENQLVYIIANPISVYAKYMPAYAQETLGATKVAIINVSDDWGRNVTNAQLEILDDYGLEAVEVTSYTQGDREFRSQITAMMAENPDVLFLNCHYTEGALITKQTRDLGYDVPILVQATCVYPQFLEIAGEQGEGVVSFDSYPPSDSAIRQEKTAWWKETFGYADFETYHINSYDIVMMYKYAFEEVGNFDDVEAVAEVIGNISGFQGILVERTHDENRLPASDVFYPIVVRDGAWVSLETGQ